MKWGEIVVEDEVADRGCRSMTEWPRVDGGRIGGAYQWCGERSSVVIVPGIHRRFMHLGSSVARTHMF
jgi:hypothetical protein